MELCSLCDELLLLVLRHLVEDSPWRASSGTHVLPGLVDILNLGETCSRLWTLSQDSSLWQHLCQSHFLQHRPCVRPEERAILSLADERLWQSEFVNFTELHVRDDHIVHPTAAIKLLEDTPTKMKRFTGWKACYQWLVTWPVSDNNLNKLRQCKLMHPVSVLTLCAKVKRILSAESHLLRICSPVTVASGTRGCLDDILDIFESEGAPPSSSFLFLGNYTGGGHSGVDAMLYLFALKIRYPSRIFLLRGKHDCGSMTRIYGLYCECKRRYKNGIAVWKMLVSVMDHLPLAAVVDDKYFCVSGGLSPQIKSLADITNIPKPWPDSGDFSPMCDMLFANPEAEVQGWVDRHKGYGYDWGADVSETWNRENKLDTIICTSLISEEGYMWMHSNRVLTLYSSRSFPGEADHEPMNRAIARIEGSNIHVKQFPKPDTSRQHKTRPWKW